MDKWDRWFDKRCIRAVDARKAYIHLAITIMDRNGIDHTDPKKEELELAWKVCIAEEKSFGHTDNEILGMKLSYIDFMEGASRTF